VISASKKAAGVKLVVQRVIEEKTDHCLLFGVGGPIIGRQSGSGCSRARSARGCRARGRVVVAVVSTPLWVYLDRLSPFRVATGRSSLP
jgi:hypothetical protein